jgi:hypothetical protein
MKSLHKLTCTAALMACTVLPTACATGAGTSVTANKSTADLTGSTWKLPMTQAGRDGRLVEFKAHGRNGYHVVLKKVGNQLEKVVGAYEGLVLMELTQDGSPRNFTGIERVPGRDLAEVRCSISAAADEMKCNNEDWVWLRDS